MVRLFLSFFFFFVLIYWHLAFFLNRLAPCLFFFSGYFPFGAQTKLALTEPRQTFQNVAEGGALGRETVVGRGWEDGEEGGVVVVDINDGENNGDEHKVTSNY